jgi:hypothetical protein
MQSWKKKMMGMGDGGWSGCGRGCVVRRRGEERERTNRYRCSLATDVTCYHMQLLQTEARLHLEASFANMKVTCLPFPNLCWRQPFFSCISLLHVLLYVIIPDTSAYNLSSYTNEKQLSNCSCLTGIPSSER